jgi:DNA-binding beta-propeller fold protein YncE
VRSHAKAATAGSNLRRAKGLGRIFRGAGATRGGFGDGDGSGAPLRRLAPLSFLAALLLAGVLALPAQAAPTTIAEGGAGAGQVDAPEGTAVEQSSGDLYVADQGNKRIDKFDSAGNFLLAWGYGVADGASEALQTCGPEASPPTTRCFAGKNFSGTIRPKAVSVDQASGDVYVADTNTPRVLKFTSSGQLIYMVGKNVNKTKVAEGGATQAEKDFCAAASGNTCGTGESGTGPNEFANPLSLAIEDSGPNAGRVWVGDNDRLVAIEPAGAPGPEAALPGAGETVSLAIDAAANFYIVRPGTTEFQEASFSGFAEGDSFRLGNLPASCSASETGPIAYSDFSFTMDPAVQEALEEECGDAIVPFTFPNGSLSFVNLLAAQDVGQLSCATLSGGGSCSVTTPRNGAPGTVEKRDSSGTLLETLYTGAPEALTLDAAGNLYVGDKRKYHFRILDPTGETTSVFGAGQVKANNFFGPRGNALALDEGSGTLYAANTLDIKEGAAVQAFPLPDPGPLPENQHVENLEPTTVTLAADLNPEGSETTYHFEWGTTESYGNNTPTETLAAEEFDAEAVEADLEELIPSTTYHFRLCASNADGANCGPDTTFTTLPAVGIEAQWASDVTATSAVLNAELDPIGVAAEWWIEYGTSDSYGQSTPESALPASFGEIPVATLLRDLVPGTTYHYRFAARDERDGNLYTVHGADKAFTTQLSGLGFELADDRAWEMVSPPQKFGAVIRQPHAQGGHLQAAANGNGLLYSTLLSIEAAPEGNRAINGSSVLARREGAGGWRSRDITLPHTTVVPINLASGLPYKLFSPNLERGLVEPADDTLHSPEASERAPYLRESTEPATYTVLVSGKEGFANVPPGTEFGGDLTETPLGAVQVTGATPELDHVVLRSNVSLATGVPALSIYLWEAGQLHPASVLPASEGGGAVAAAFGAGGASVRKAISEDGSRVFWSTGGTLDASDMTGLYLRDMDREETVRLDVVQPGSFGTGEANPVFQGANSEGTVAFFTDSHQLTEDANEEGRDLYRCEVTVEGGELGCDLTNLTAGTVGAKESAEVQGLASGMGDDATQVYFVANGVLDSVPNEHGDSAVSDEPNLYLWQQGGGTRFIATLSDEDKTDWASNPGGADDLEALRLSAAASPNGRYLAFMSQRSLTGYDNRDAVTDEPNQEVFRYDAAADELICASCNPSGASPAGLRGHEGVGEKAFDPLNLWSGEALAAVLPEAINTGNRVASLYRPRAVHDNGRLFFNAADSLVPADSNGQWDVYQYEPTGLGDCAASSGGAAVSRSAGGCVALISSGTGEKESAFLDASVGGNDVFFYSSAQLSVTDEDQEVDVYDARVNGIAATLTPNAECLGEACQPAANAPNDPTPASASFKGRGNPKPAARKRCGKGKRLVRRKGRSRCVVRQRARKGKAGKTRKGKASNGRRASR